MKRRDLLNKIEEAAKNTGVEFVLVREGGSHSIYRCGGEAVVVARHNEITEGHGPRDAPQARRVVRKDWWK